MRKINQSGIEDDHRVSPKATYELHRKHVSIALGGKKDIGVWGGGHPFDVELSVLPRGKRNFPFHSHAAQWEHYIIISGNGRIQDNDRNWHRVEPGDHVVFPPGEAHLLENDSNDDLVYYVISDHHPADITAYPNTGKRQMKPEYRIVQIKDCDYYENEE